MMISRTAVFARAGLPIEIVEIEVPPLGPHEVLVRNEMATLCRSDLATYTGQRIEPTPTILGHEVVGRICDFGPGASRVDLRGEPLRIGDRITWAIFASDPASPMAARGMPQKSADRCKYGHEQITFERTLHGGLSQYIILRPHTPIIKISEDIPVRVAAITNCALATIAGAFRLAGPERDRKILVSGAGMLGVLACAMAQCLGAAHVVAMDIDPARLAMARRFGADSGIVLPIEFDSVQSLEPPAFGAFDLVIEASGVPWSMEKTLPLLGVGGVAVWIGAVSPVRPVSLPAEQIVRNLLTIRGLHNYNVDDFLASVTFLETYHQRFPLMELIDDRFSLDEINDAFEYAIAANPYRVGVHL
jgi:putative phosphonate catabolism associated alcohol dehydrogenase